MRRIALSAHSPITRQIFLGLLITLSFDWSTSIQAQKSGTQRPAIPQSPSLTVADLQHILAADRGKSDNALTQHLSCLVLTDRMSEATLNALKSELPGPRSRAALIAIADASLFQPSSSADVLQQTPPDLEEQRRILAKAVDYAGKTVPRLPNFYATETTVHYDAADTKGKNAISNSNPSWHEIGATHTLVTYRDGKEVIDPPGWARRPREPEGEGLITRGLFGPMLYTVLVDAAHGRTVWSHWENGGRGPLAVFRYQVSRSQSHYAVAFRSRTTGPGFAELPTAYHGEMAIDAATGTILRLIAQADLPFGSPIFRGDITVQYGPVEIGGTTYTCPVRSVTIFLNTDGLSGGALAFESHKPKFPPNAMLLNDTAFHDYHLFRSQMKILTDAAMPP